MALLNRWRKGAPASERRLPTLPDGLRAYAIGDVHGRLDLLRDLMAMVQTDDQGRPPAETHVVLLGDLIDRGPDTRGVLDFLLTERPDFARFHFIRGNHEDMLLKIIVSPTSPVLASYLRFGGWETFESYGVPEEVLAVPERHPPTALVDHVPEDHRAFLEAMEDGIHVGDYLFTHAGIRPGVPLAEQEVNDLRWIREEFLESEADHGVIVVHGHTITEQIEERPNRIGIDTGAYATGVLTALGLEGTDRWFLQTAGAPAD